MSRPFTCSLTLTMKTVSFLRGSWRKKDKKASTPILSSTSEHVHSGAPSSLPSKPTYYDSPSFHTLQFEPLPLIDFSLRDSDNASHSSDSQGSSGHAEKQNSDRVEKLSSQTRLRFNGNHGALFNTSHGPPHNPSHGPPNFNRLSPTTRPNTAPSRPPRPPSLDLYSHPRPASATPRSPNRVRFAPVPQIRPPDSPSRHSFRHIGQTKGPGIVDPSNGSDYFFNSDGTTSLQAPQHAEIPSHVVAKSHNRMASKYIHVEEHSPGTTAFVITTAHPSPSDARQDSHRTVHAVLDLSDMPSPRSLYHATGSSPHLPYKKDSKDKSSRSKSESSKNDNEGKPSKDFPLGLFPSPPPLVIRKRPKPLVLLPTPTLARLPPSPAFSSADSTPPTTPTTPRPPHSAPSNVTLRKAPGRSLSSLPPPTYSPPNTPLPTPPTSPSTILTVPVTRQLRSAQSTADFRSQYPQPSGGHRPTLSAPSDSTEPNRRRTHSRPDVPASSYLVNISMCPNHKEYC